jgi:predicted GNAT superfamily acetyltransferase
MIIRPLTSIEDFRRVYSLEQEIWGYTSAEDSVPVPMMIVSAKTGGLLLGAFESERDTERGESGELVGFAYSLPALANGRPYHWSHMLGIVERHRGSGLGWQIKVEQRRRVLDAGLDLIEWTFDPLQALNAHFNFVKLGASSREYHVNVYGESSSALHRGTATDRLIVEWWLTAPSVVERIAETVAGQARPGVHDDAVPVNQVAAGGEWLAPGRCDLSVDAPCLAVTIPTGFTEMQQRDLPLARAWRDATREIFCAYLHAGFEVVDFVLDANAGRGTYLLHRRRAAEP